VKTSRSKICLTVAEPNIGKAIETIVENRKWIDIAEIRADFFREDEIGDIGKLPSLSPVPLMFTLRREQDGGKWNDEEAARHQILLNAAGTGFSYLDLESDVEFSDVESECGRSKTRIIRSFHDFNGVPANLSRLLKTLGRTAGEIPKAAVMPSSTRDLVNIVSVFDELKDQEKILLGMGSWGFPTRVLAGKLGSYLTFCSPPNQETAPGHIDPQSLVGLYRFREIKPSTVIFCVIANPVMHSRSPHIHNPGLSACKIDAVYIPIQVDELSSFFDLVSLLDIQGISVTLPHKEAVRAFLNSEDDSVNAVGSCNTVFPVESGWKGTNTDVPGFLAPLVSLVGEDALKRKSVTIIGAGGTARAAAYALMSYGARVCILNRTPEKAGALAKEFGCSFGGLERDSLELIAAHRDIIVQTSSAGMSPLEDIDPFEFYDFIGTEIAYDVIYVPALTRFLRRAADAGCVVLNGEAMLHEQAYRQFELFTGRQYPDVSSFHK
jgi:3-dehydroquinate dehydratase / shikimate dehydrogenase